MSSLWYIAVASGNRCAMDIHFPAREVLHLHPYRQLRWRITMTKYLGCMHKRMTKMVHKMFDVVISLVVLADVDTRCEPDRVGCLVWETSTIGVAIHVYNDAASTYGQNAHNPVEQKI